MWLPENDFFWPVFSLKITFLVIFNPVYAAINKIIKIYTEIRVLRQLFFLHRLESLETSQKSTLVFDINENSPGSDISWNIILLTSGEIRENRRNCYLLILNINACETFPLYDLWPRILFRLALIEKSNAKKLNFLKNI